MNSPSDNAGGSTHTRSTLHVGNIHCLTCVSSIKEILSSISCDKRGRFQPVISDIDISVATGNVSFTYLKAFGLKLVMQQLDVAGFDVWHASRNVTLTVPEARLSSWRVPHRPFPFLCSKSARLRQREDAHRRVCRACRTQDGSEITLVKSVGVEKQGLYDTRLAIEGMTCSSCTSAISSGLSPSSEAGINSCEVTLLPPSAIVIHDADILSAEGIKDLIEEIGFGAEIVSSKKHVPSSNSVANKPHSTSYKVVYTILGMTCTSCVSSVTRAMESVPGTASVSVDLMGNTASVIVKQREDAELVRSEVEDVGFECTVVEIIDQHDNDPRIENKTRTVKVKVDGMFSKECVNQVKSTLEDLSQSHALTFTPITLDNPTIDLTYVPMSPAFTLRKIRAKIISLGFTLSIVHVDSIEQRTARARAREQRHILIRLVITFLVVIPTFVIGVIGMSLLNMSHKFRIGLETPAWGNASRGTVALFALATPIQFGVGQYFYVRAWKSLKGVWRKRRASADWRKVWSERLFRWGSMDTLVALGTTIGYGASLTMMVLDITTVSQGMKGGEMSWFDSAVFLMLFILAGRYMESVSKQHTGDAISTLSSTKPSTGLLFTAAGSSTTEESADFLEVGDVLLIPVGASPPLDAVLAPSSPQTTFNESSLTGEARPVLKSPGDEVFAGTTNAGPAAAVITVTHEAGKTMLDGIVGVVRDAMGKKAGIERIVDVVTGYFVPFAVGVASLTFGVWCLRGYLGHLPMEWLSDQRRGDWVLFAVEFGVAVLVAACPCGIGLAAPTAQMVGVGLAAENGILSNGGGEAFQVISSMNTVVLDKTGTLTTSKFTLSDHRTFVDDSSHPLVCAMMLAVEQASTHPVAVGVREWCQKELAAAEKAPVVDLISSEEIPGRGLVATLVVEGNKVELAIGNEKLMDYLEAQYKSHDASAQAKSELLAWQTGGKSVVLLSAKAVLEAASSPLGLPITAEHHSVLGLFGVHDPPRPEAAPLVTELQRLNIDVWMISGDSETTARTVARSIGIDQSHVVGGALPVDKQNWVKKLQEGRPSGPSSPWWSFRSSGRNIVAFCGDGINDAPAIAQADVGLAMGGGSNVAVSTADFCLLGSNPLALVTAHSVARATRRRIMSNFVWACVYNIVLMPLAAGAFYPLRRTRLPPVWGAAAMALSSVSVVVNSLFLRWTYKPPQVVRRWNHNDQV